MSLSLKNTAIAFFLSVSCVCYAGIISPPARQLVEDPDTTLVLVHAICRHGMRTTYSFYPNDPHKNNTFYPMGPGGLLNKGKMTGFKLGQKLRDEYGYFLGDTYTDELIHARSTDTIRTRMTAQVILAGLFPPNKNQQWHPYLSWMPIPVYTKDSVDEDIINPSCPYKQQLLDDLPNIPEVFDKFISPYQELFAYVEKHSGKSIKSLSDLIEFFFIVNTEADMGLELPEWAEKIYPEPLYSAAAHVYEYQNYNEEIRKLNMGFFLKRILNDSISISKGELEPKNRKFFLFGAHESTLGWMMEHLKVFQTHIPPYSSSFLIETHKDKENNYYIKLRYSDEIEGPIKDMKMPHCDMYCPLEKFIQMNKDILPKETAKEACHLTGPKN